MTVADRIKFKREELGLTQEELAHKMGYASKSAVSRTENAGDNIGQKRIKEFANALGVSISYIMGFEDSIATEPASISNTQDEDELKNIALLHAFMKQLNEEGYQEALKRISELTELPKYKKD